MSVNVVAVGPTRTGTTSLFRNLISYDLVVGSKVKELDYFLSPATFESNYHSYFEGVGDFFLEASPKYFLYSEVVCSNIKKEINNPKIIIILRDPVDRIKSIFNHIYNKRKIGLYSSVDEIASIQITDSSYRFSSDEIDSGSFSEGLYLKNLPVWIEAFGSENVGIFFYENMKDENFLSDVFKFLGVDISCSKMTVENVSRSIGNLSIHHFAKRANDSLEPFFNKFPKARSTLRDAYYFLNNKKPDCNILLSDSYEKKFKDLYDLENDGLLDYLRNKKVYGDFPGWLK